METIIQVDNNKIDQAAMLTQHNKHSYSLN